MEKKFSGLGALILFSILALVLAIGWYAAGIGKKGGVLEKGTQTVDESHAIKASLDARAGEENEIIDQLP